MSLNNSSNLTNNKILSTQNYKYTINDSNNFKNLDIKEKNIILLKEKIRTKKKI